MFWTIPENKSFIWSSKRFQQSRQEFQKHKLSLLESTWKYYLISDIIIAEKMETFRKGE